MDLELYSITLKLSISCAILASFLRLLHSSLKYLIMIGLAFHYAVKYFCAVKYFLL